MTGREALALLDEPAVRAYALARGLAPGEVCAMPVGERPCIRLSTHADGCLPAPSGYWPRPTDAVAS